MMLNEVSWQDTEKHVNVHIKESLQILYQSNILTQTNSDLVINHFNTSNTSSILQFMQKFGLLSDINFKLITENITKDIEQVKSIAVDLLYPYTHYKVLELGKYLGYPFNKGICHGFTLKWLESCFLKEEDRFVQRIREILFAESLEHLLVKINNVKVSAKANKLLKLTEDEIDALEILAFYESLLLYQCPENHIAFFNKPINQDNIEDISKIAACEKIMRKGGLKTIYSEPFIFTRDEMFTYFNDIRNIIKQVNTQNEINAGIQLTSGKHAIGLVFQPENDRFMDINKWPPKKYKPDELNSMVDEIIESFDQKGSPYTSFNVSVVAIQNPDLQHELFTKLSTLKQKITKEIAQRETQEGMTLAYLAAQHGHVGVITQLAENGADLNKSENTNTTPAWIASQNGHAPVIAELARQGADLSKPNKDNSIPALIASQYGHASVIAELSKNGADLNSEDTDGRTPALMAAQDGHASVIAELGKSGVDLNKSDQNGITPAFIAAQNGHVTVIAELAKYGVDLNIAHPSGKTPAIMAAQQGHASVIAELAKNGADLNKGDNNGVTPAAYAAQHGHANVIAELATCGSDLNKLNNFGLTPAWLAAQNGHVDVITELAKHNADLNIPNKNGSSPAYIAAQNGHVGVIAELAKHNADLNMPNNNGSSPAYIAAQNGHVGVIAELAKHGADLNKQSKNGAMPTVAAAQNGHAAVIVELAKHNVDLNKACNGITPLFIVSEKGNANMVQFLLEKKVNIQPSMFTPNSLYNFVKSRPPAVIERMEKFIEYKKQNSHSENYIPVLPNEIAYVMGHEEVVNLFSNIGVLMALASPVDNVDSLSTKEKVSENKLKNY